MTVLSTLAYENENEKKGNPPNRDLDKQTNIARDTWMPSLENYMYVICALTACTRTVVCNPGHFRSSSLFQVCTGSIHVITVILSEHNLLQKLWAHEV